MHPSMLVCRTFKRIETSRNKMVSTFCFLFYVVTLSVLYHVQRPVRNYSTVMNVSYGANHAAQKNIFLRAVLNFHNIKGSLKYGQKN